MDHKTGLQLHSSNPTTNIPTLPTLIVVPNNLVENWSREVKKFLLRGSIDLFMVLRNSLKRQGFFTGMSSLWQQSGQTHGQRVVISQCSVCPCCVIA
jgi:SNF2 family DNA or RNA helicase